MVEGSEIDWLGESRWLLGVVMVRFNYLRGCLGVRGLTCFVWDKNWYLWRRGHYRKAHAGGTGEDIHSPCHCCPR
jgi:hypothetical protein